ncbi:MAG: hypothetical protein ABIK38_00105 [candidate division WOR-3 bacterium]
MKYNKVIMIAGILLAIGMGSLLTAGDPDLRVKAILDDAGYKYEIDSDNDFKMVFDTDENRTQLVFVNSGTETYGDFEIREVWSPVYKFKGNLPAGHANKLLEQSYMKKIGSFDVWVRSDGSKVVRFCAKIAADADASTLTDVIRAVYTTADLMEKELTGKKDEY